jgi:hypothetical protein
VDAENNLVIPTLWAELGRIEYSVNPCGDDSTDPQLPVWAQLQAQIEDTKDYTELTKKPQINGVELAGNRTLEELGVGVPTDEQVSNAVNAYLEVNPITGAAFEKHSGNLWDGTICADPGLGGNIFTIHNGTAYYKTVVFKAKPNTSYVITTPNIENDEGFGQANANGICTQAPVSTTNESSPVTFINWKIGTGGLGKYISVKTNDNFSDDTVYLVWKTTKNTDLTGAIVFEGSDPADYVNVGEYSPENGTVTSIDLVVTEKNLTADINDKLAKGSSRCRKHRRCCTVH